MRRQNGSRVLPLAPARSSLQVAILCNHQRAVPKTHGNQMEKMQASGRRARSFRHHTVDFRVSSRVCKRRHGDPILNCPLVHSMRFCSTPPATLR